MAIEVVSTGDEPEVRFTDRDIFELTDALESLGDIVDSVRKSASGVLDDVSGAITGIIDPLVGSIKSTFDNVKGFMKTLFDSAVNGVQETLAETIANLKNVMKSIGDFIDNAVLKAKELFDNMVAFVSNIIDPVISEIKNLVLGAFQTIRDFAGIIISEVSGYFQNIADTIVETARGVIDSAKGIVDGIKTAIQEFVDSVVGFAGDTLKSLMEVIGELPQTLEDLRVGLIDSVKENIGRPISEIGKELSNALGKSLGIASANDIASAQAFIAALTQPGAGGLGTFDKMYDALNRGESKNGLTWMAFELISIPILAWTVLSGVANAQGQVHLKEYAINNRYHQLQVADIVDAQRRGLIDSGQFETKLAEHGVTNADMTVYQGLGRQFLPVGDLITLWLRDLYTDDQISERMRALGYSEDDISRVMEAAFFIPPPQDLITMAVREAFSPATVARFGQGEDFPEDFAKYAAMQGISEEWARHYWAAHWSLPSPQMGFEMLHRRIINQDDLELLLKSLDIMPFWRDRLIKLSFSPLTRVDVRRMFDLGVITEQEVYEAYLDLGYDEKNAKRLADFTKLLSKSGGSDDAAELKGLTRAKVVDLYKDAVLGREEAGRMLRALGNSEDAAELYLLDADLALDLENRKLQLSLIEQEVKAGITDLNEARGRLSELGFSTAEVERAILKMVNASKLKTKIPNEDALAGMFKKGIITAQLYLDSLEALGYSEAWSERIVKLNGGTINER